MLDQPFYRNLDDIQDPYLLVRLLLEEGEKLSPKLHKKILAKGDAAVGPLIKLLNNEAVQMEDAPGKGWAPIHAVQLLAELRAEAAIQPMLKWLLETEPAEDILHSRLMSALASFGPSAIEPVFAVYEETEDPEYQRSLCDVLVESGVKDERIFRLVLAYLQEDPEYGAMCASLYQDPELLPHLIQVLDGHNIVEDPDDPLAASTNQAVVELCNAIKQLGGTLTSAQQQKYQRTMKQRGKLVQQLESMLDAGLADQVFPKKRGRNDPCWCGSGKKYKHCHWKSDKEHRN